MMTDPRASARQELTATGEGGSAGRLGAMLRRLNCIEETGSLADVLPKPGDAGTSVAAAVAEILEQVRRGGDAAVAELTARFDPEPPATARVAPEEVTAALDRIDGGLRHALEVAWSRVLAYHQTEGSLTPEFNEGGVRVRHLRVPVDRVGMYAPGGLARYPSSVLMAAAPARAAGVAELVLCVPPGPGGRLDDATLAAAALAGVTEVYAIGGAQAIAAMAYGTETIRPVDVIVGPGNAYVAEAKRQVSGVVGVASAFAGPSEVAVVADATTPPLLAAIDLMVQAEHGPDGFAWLITWDLHLADAVEEELVRLVAAAPRRAELEATFASGGYCCLVRDAAQAMEVVNVVAPEHLELLVEDFEPLLAQVRNAGAIFCGPSAPASFGDYLAGPNHILPTNRTARFASALRTEDFFKYLHAVEVSPTALATLGPEVVRLARAEGLEAHAQSIELRR